MKKILSQKVISLVVMFAFVTVFCFPAYPAQVTTDRTEKLEKVEKSGDKALEKETKGKTESGTEVKVDEYYSRDDANVIEDEGVPGVKKRKYPWLLVAGGIIVVGVVLYLLVIKKPKYDLTVTVGEGVFGTPVSGLYTYKKGERVRYSYTLKNGYSDLTIRVNGIPGSASGTIEMTGDKSLTVSATEIATLVVNSNPTGAQIILDGADSGEVTNHTFTFTSGGNHMLKLREVGYIEYSSTKFVALGHTETVNAALTRGLREHFSTGATSSILWKWLPHPSGNWNITGGKYTADATVSDCNYSIYNLDWASDKYTVTVRMNRAVGSTSTANLVILATGTVATALNGYRFNYTANGDFSTYRMNGYNIDGVGGSIVWKKAWTYSPAINTGLGDYNNLTIVRNGTTYTFYINNKLVDSFNDDIYDPRYVIIGGFCGGTLTQLNFDSVYVEIGSTSGSVPGSRVDIPQSAVKDNPEYHKR